MRAPSSPEIEVHPASRWYSSQLPLHNSNKSMEASRQQVLQQEPFQPVKYTDNGQLSIESDVFYVPVSRNRVALDASILLKGFLYIQIIGTLCPSLWDIETFVSGCTLRYSFHIYHAHRCLTSWVVGTMTLYFWYEWISSPLRVANTSPHAVLQVFAIDPRLST